MIKLAVKFLEARIPASIEMLKRVSQCSVWILKNLSESDEESLRDIEIASFLSQAGRIFLPDSMLKMPVLIDGAPTDPLMCQVPQSGKAIVESINRFRHVALIIGHIYENFDGSGIPDRLKSWQIPLESRIIRASLDFEELRALRNLSSKNAIEILRKESQRLYDNRVVILLEQYLKSHDKELYDPFEVAVQLAELKDGMIITRDIYTNKGLKLIPSGATLSTKTIERLISHNSTDPILGNVHVKKA
jgi:response regulator RpfG family c-di-GMP phosphodiesterase